MGLLSKLTLVMLTYKRQNYALRNMRFWSGRGATLCVLDGSDQPISADDLGDLAPNIRYHHLPVSLFERLGIAPKLVATEYAALLGDDELYLPSGVEACVRELDENREIVSCMGRALGFRPRRGHVLGYPAYPEMSDYSVLQDDPGARMIRHMSPYTCSTIYAVSRTSVWQKAFAITPVEEFSLYAVSELQVELAIAYLGKSKVIPHLMWLRSRENDALGEGRPTVKFDQWWVDTAKSDERSRFSSLMARMLANGDGGATQSIASGVDAACHTYYEYTRGTFRDTPRTAIVRRLPVALRRVIRRTVDALPMPRRQSLMQTASELASTGVHVDFVELSEIIALIREFHSGASAPHGAGVRP